MGYFPNGTSGMFYEEQFCWNCVHWNEGACPIMDAHNLYNYDQHDDDKLKVVLSLLIPETKDGLGNEQCAMFRAVADPEAEWSEQRRLAEQPEKYAAAIAQVRAA